MGNYMPNTIVVLGIIINILGGMLSLIYIYRSCTAEGFNNDLEDSYLAQIKSCFIWSNILILFTWLVTPQGSEQLILSAIKIGVYIWIPVFVLSILSMFPYMKLISRKINADYISFVRGITARSLWYSAFSVLIFWFIS